MRRFLSVSLLASSLLSACSSRTECTDLFAPGVQLTVVNSQGAKLRDVRVTYSVDGGPLTEAICLQSPADNLNLCELWGTDDAPGEHRVYVQSADGKRTVDQAFQVEGDECHAIPQQATVTLPD